MFQSEVEARMGVEATDLGVEVRRALLEEQLTDCSLVSREGVAIRVHRLLLSPCTSLHRLLLAAACCSGRCASQPAEVTLLLPDVPYAILKVCIDFLYRGEVVCSREERSGVREVLEEVLGVRGGIRVEERSGGGVDCSVCSVRVGREEVVEHMLEEHVMVPAARDMEGVARGNNARVRCSYTSSSCSLDPDNLRISNGFYNYLGEAAVGEGVRHHYEEVHLRHMLEHLQGEMGEEVEVAVVEEYRHRLLTLGQEVVVEVPSEEEEGERTDYSGGMYSSAEEQEEDTPPNDDDPNDAEEEGSACRAILLEPEGSPRVEGKRKAEEEMEAEGGGGSGAKRARRSGGQGERRCRWCEVVVRGEHFPRHVVKHMYDRWQVSREEGRRRCTEGGCTREFSGWQALVVHLATTHGQLAEKLREEDESLSDYELKEVDDTPEERIRSLESATKKKVTGLLDTMDFPADFFNRGSRVEEAGEAEEEEEAGEVEEEEELARVEELMSGEGTSCPEDSEDTEPYRSGGDTSPAL